MPDGGMERLGILFLFPLRLFGGRICGGRGKRKTVVGNQENAAVRTARNAGLVRAILLFRFPAIARYIHEIATGRHIAGRSRTTASRRRTRAFRTCHAAHNRALPDPEEGGQFATQQGAQGKDGKQSLHDRFRRKGKANDSSAKYDYPGKF